MTHACESHMHTLVKKGREKNYLNEHFFGFNKIADNNNIIISYVTHNEFPRL